MKSNFEVLGTVIANLRAGFSRVGNYLAGAVLTARGGIENEALFQQSALWRSGTH